MKKVIILIWFACVISSCNLGKDTGCHDDFRENLEDLRVYVRDSMVSNNLTEIERKIEFLESKSGVKNKDQGGTLGKFFVTDEDISNWQEWLDEQCEESD